MNVREMCHRNESHKFVQADNQDQKWELLLFCEKCGRVAKAPIEHVPMLDEPDDPK